MDPNKNLCVLGAQSIRNHWADMLKLYAENAQELAKIYKDNPSIWLIEPDFVQYSVLGDPNDKQVGGAISNADMATKYGEIVRTIKTYMPNAKIGLDISPWLNEKLATWYSYFDASMVDLFFTSGGDTRAALPVIRDRDYNFVTWKEVAQSLGGKPVLADDGYGVGGGNIPDYDDWLRIDNIKERSLDGVIGVSVSITREKYSEYTAQIAAAHAEACALENLERTDGDGETSGENTTGQASDDTTTEQTSDEATTEQTSDETSNVSGALHQFTIVGLVSISLACIFTLF